MLPIVLRGACTNNLQGVSVTLEPGTLVALTGPSGAGKSSLALETFHAEGQRRFIESFTPYARQFLERRERPPVDVLDPIAATVAVDRRAPVKSSRSTLATLADLEPYLAALFGAESIPVCPTCNVDAVRTDPRKAAQALSRDHDGERAIVSYRERAASTEQFLELRERLLREGYRRLFVGGEVRDLDEVRPSEVTASSAGVDVILDRVTLASRDLKRLSQALESAWGRGTRAYVHVEKEGRYVARPLARGLVCPKCATAFDEPKAALFSYNSPMGACAACKGFGRVIGVDWDKVIPDPSRSLADAAIRPWGGKSTEWERGALNTFCAKKKIPTDVPWQKLSRTQQNAVLDGEGTWDGGRFPGVRAWFKWLETRTYKMHVRVFLARYREYTVCGACDGARLNERARTYRVAGLSLPAWHALTVDDAFARLDAITSPSPQGARARDHMHSRLRYLSRVGLGYLTLDRQARTLSGGETQRAGLTTALGAKLTGTLFVVDEPSTGLHALDVPPLAEAIRELATAGNTVLLVEHDPTLIDSADRVIELGPGAGKHGGRIVYDGTVADRPRAALPVTSEARRATNALPHESLVVKGARENNLRGVSVNIPRGALTAITGPSGSGKSTLAEDVIYRNVARALGDTNVAKGGACDSIEGANVFGKAVLVDQSPLGRTARGNTATYTKAWDRLRARFAVEPDAKKRKLTAAHFSFNTGNGRCEACNGEGCETVEMQFLADVRLVCPTCHGRRFKPNVLEAKLGGLDVASVLALTVDEAIAKYCEGEYYDPVLRRALEPVRQVGLGYLPLGQPLSTLSGGEAQRLKLARALSEPAKRALFVVDEPSAGLHARDVAFVLASLRALVSEGATVVVVEHDLDVIRGADYIIDLGPGGGPHGGQVVAAGTYETILAADTKTGDALRSDAKARKPKPARALRTKKTAAARVEAITVSHAREHTLRNVSCSIPHGQLTVVTGPSGSGKSSLAFDVIFAEGQRRFMETLSPYARQFLPTLPRPDVDDVQGVPPSIALEQRIARAGANSTVATVTEVAHYVRLLYAKIGEMHCPKCDTRVAVRSSEELFRDLVTQDRERVRDINAKYTLYAAAVRARKGTYLDVFTQASRAGVRTARVDGRIIEIEPPPKLMKSKEHTIDLIVHYGSLKSLDRATFDRAVLWGEGTLRLAKGEPRIDDVGEELLSTARACPRCGTGVPEIDPRWFSWNTKQGQCGACEGTGIDGGPAGLQPDRACRVCHGERLSPVPRRVRLAGETYPTFSARSVKSALAAARAFRFVGRSAEIAEAPHKELVRRLEFLVDVGLDYLSLDRPAGTLSGGEIQRLRLSAQLGSGLTGALYVLDEPTIGLHPRDTGRLLRNLRGITEAGSTVIVVEHDAETIRAADHVVDMGPGGGSHGGQIVCEGPAKTVLASKSSPTGQALRSPHTARIPRPPSANRLVLAGARGHNLRGVDVSIPHASLTVVCGVSGSGKSTLVGRVLYPALRRALDLVADEPLPFGSLTGVGPIRRAIRVDQSPIGRTPRSVPATFLGLWDDIRKLFAALPEAQVRGYSPARFSFNTKGGGRCEACEGQGAVVHEMSFLPDVVSTCETCQGLRFEPNTLDVRYRDRSIGDVLHLTAEEAVDVFSAHPRIARPLRTVCDLGLGYLQIGQGSHTLSGGEAQRLKLAAELTAGVAHEPTVYVLDEPTTGLHISDVGRLLTVLDRLVDRGDTLVVVEHHPDVIRSADWVLELGPEAGEDGGRVVYEGPAKGLALKKTPTGIWLRDHARESPPPPKRPKGGAATSSVA